jgi:hypothetical protein
MCSTPKPPKAPTPAAAPAPALATASFLKMGERTPSRDGTFDPNTARARRTLRTDLRMPAAGAGASIARMG